MHILADQVEDHEEMELDPHLVLDHLDNDDHRVCQSSKSQKGQAFRYNVLKESVSVSVGISVDLKAPADVTKCHLIISTNT